MGLIFVVSKIFILNVVEIYQWHWVDESGKRFDNVDGALSSKSNIS